MERQSTTADRDVATRVAHCLLREAVKQLEGVGLIAEALKAVEAMDAVDRARRCEVVHG